MNRQLASLVFSLAVSIVQCACAERAEPVQAQVQFESFSGTWRASNSRGVDSLKFARTTNGVTLRAFAFCGPKPCDWGVATVELFNEDLNADGTTRVAVARFEDRGIRSMLVMKQLDADRIDVSTLTTFADGSKRPSIVAERVFARSNE